MEADHLEAVAQLEKKAAAEEEAEAAEIGAVLASEEATVLADLESKAKEQMVRLDPSGDQYAAILAKLKADSAKVSFYQRTLDHNPPMFLTNLLLHPLQVREDFADKRRAQKAQLEARLRERQRGQAKVLEEQKEAAVAAVEAELLAERGAARREEMKAAEAEAMTEAEAGSEGKEAKIHSILRRRHAQELRDLEKSLRAERAAKVRFEFEFQFQYTLHNA